MKNFVKIVCLFFLLLCVPAFADTPPNDNIILKNVKNNLSNDPTISHLPIVVSIKNGVVTLQGTVETDDQAEKIVEIAESSTGVKDVNESKLKVKKSNDQIKDSMITAKVKGIFIREKLFGDGNVAPMSISVETKNGVVYLTGTAHSNEQIANAEKLAGSVKGVAAVDNKVTLQPQ